MRDTTANTTEYFVIVGLENGRGVKANRSAVFTVPDGTTRADLFQQAVKYFGSLDGMFQPGQFVVTFFDCQPNALPMAPPATAAVAA